MTPSPSVMTNFNSRTDLHHYDSNALLLYALELKRDIDDIAAVASQSLLDGGDDKGCDLLYLDYDSESAVVGQGYFATVSREAAKSTKAEAIGNAASWLLGLELSTLPERMRSPAVALRTAIKDGTINTIEIWYVHNCPESTNVKTALQGVEHTFQSVIQRNFDQSCQVRALEVGLESLESWYRETQAAIIINDAFTVPIPGGFEQATNLWQAYSTAVPATWLYDLYRKFGVKLFSANVRDYLGSRGGDRNINNGIKNSVEKQPENFWVFNIEVTQLSETH